MPPNQASKYDSDFWRSELAGELRWGLATFPHVRALDRQQIELADQVAEDDRSP